MRKVLSRRDGDHVLTDRRKEQPRILTHSSPVIVEQLSVNFAELHFISPSILGKGSIGMGLVLRCGFNRFVANVVEWPIQNIYSEIVHNHCFACIRLHSRLKHDTASIFVAE